MRRLFAVLLLLAVALIPAQASADHLQKPLQRLVDWSGCDAELVTSDEEAAVNSFYSPMEHRLYIGTSGEGNPTAEAVLMIALHEIGHCLQDENGSPLWDDGVALELDADRLAADMACALGLDGPQLLHDLFVWAHEVYGYDGDGSHGTLAQRISQSDRAPACHLPPVQTA